MARLFDLICAHPLHRQPKPQPEPSLYDLAVETVQSYQEDPMTTTPTPEPTAETTPEVAPEKHHPLRDRIAVDFERAERSPGLVAAASVGELAEAAEVFRGWLD